MKPIGFKESNVVYAKDQPQYLPLPAHVNHEDGIVTTRWHLTFWERLKVFMFGEMWFQQMNFNQPLQPQKPSIEKPIIGK